MPVEMRPYLSIAATGLIKNATDKRHLAKAVQVALIVTQELMAMAAPGVALETLEAEANRLLALNQCSAPFKRYEQFGFATCISLNEGFVNGQPQGKTLVEGDLLSIAVGAEYRGLNGKSAQTQVVGRPPTPDEARLIDGTRAVFDQLNTRAMTTVNDLVTLTEQTIRSAGLVPMRESGGCGIGKAMHQWPIVPNLAEELDESVPLVDGMALTLMPMASLGQADTWHIGPDGWTYVTDDNALAAHWAEVLLYENHHWLNLSQPE